MPVEDIDSNSSIQFIVAKFDDIIVGSVALERFNSIGLLRSLCVKEEFRKDGVGLSLINRIFDFARNEKVSEIYLLTTSADKYFAKFGFKELNRKNAPVQIQKTSQFRDLCPSSAILMHKAI
ncbi:acetyltransferase (GNAT) domain protein [Leptospira ryugenii]|uniref:Acetyltransferase (GNAT) domain protein n=1 Tax=Leptospira ryugenii TaxID=1917863 RepID=A0A2P2E5B8_9LEPT|nr:acetyltransferase (GNAT) domain protein [Leptospira ryugenii]